MENEEIAEQLHLLRAQGWQFSPYDETPKRIVFAGEKHTGKTKEKLKFATMIITFIKPRKQ